MTKIEDQYIGLFERFRSELDLHSSAGLNRYRDAAFETFKRMGFPHSGQEAYKHSNIVQRFEPDMGLNLRNIPIHVNPYDAFRCDVPNLATHLSFLINDRYYDTPDLPSHLPENVFVGSLRRFSERFPDIFAAHYTTIAGDADNGVVAYNTMFAQDGFVVYVPKNVVLDKPLQLINILRGNVHLNVNRRLLIIAEDYARMQLLVCDHTVDAVPFTVTQVTEVFAGAHAEVDLYELEENAATVTRLNNLFCEQQEHASVVMSGITLHNGYSRNNYRFRLKGPCAEAHLGGLAICDDTKHIDNDAFVDHVAPDCVSNELFKNVLQEQATGAFCGRISVEKDAQRTAAFQTNRNLCTSRQARIFSKPQLEIYADDVKCSHGLTTGQLDEEALFYMRSRGIDEAEARLLLMVAFTRDVVDLVRIPILQERLASLINKRFRGELFRCGNCNICK